MSEPTEAEEKLTGQPHVTPLVEKIAALIQQNGPIHQQEAKGQQANAELAKHYSKAEKDFHGNKQAVKLVRNLLKKPIDQQYDFMRTFELLADHFNLWPEHDLADAAEDGDDQGAGRKPGFKSALDDAREHLQGGTKPDDDKVSDIAGARGRKQNNAKAEGAALQ